MTRIEKSGNEWKVVCDGYEMFKGTEAECHEYIQMMWGTK
jgi:hypothetical protein